MSTFDTLINERLTGLFMSSDQKMIAFRTVENKYITFFTEADCCNNVWFNHITGVNLIRAENIFDIIRGVLVISTEDKGWNENASYDDCNVVQDGFWTIKTSKGYLDIEVRNSHNGYYGGSVSPIRFFMI